MMARFDFVIAYQMTVLALLRLGMLVLSPLLVPHSDITLTVLVLVVLRIEILNTFVESLVTHSDRYFGY